MKKIVATLACRNQGSRLYGKPLQNLDIKNKICILDNLIDCLSNFKVINEIVLCISEGDDNICFKHYAKSRKLHFIIGSEVDVLARLIRGGEVSDATEIFRVTTESPFPYFEMIDMCCNYHLDNNMDATFLDKIIDGCGFEIIKLESLKKSHLEGLTKHRSEHCSLYIRENKNKFNIKVFAPPNNLTRKDIRLTVDYPEDLILCRNIYNEFKNYSPLIPLEKVVNFIDNNDELKKIVEPLCEDGYKMVDW